jgi:hypothetical protein
MHVLINTVLSMSIDTRVLRKSALLRKKVMKRTREVLSDRVGTKNMNGRVILCANHRSKSLIGSKHLSPSLQKIYPGEAREIINKDNIVTMIPLRKKGAGPHTSD